MDLVDTLIKTIDSYWAGEVSEEDFVEHLNTLINKNTEKVFSNGKYKPVVVQRLGKKRLQLLGKVYKEMGDI